MARRRGDVFDKAVRGAGARGEPCAEDSAGAIVARLMARRRGDVFDKAVRRAEVRVCEASGAWEIRPMRSEYD